MNWYCTNVQYVYLKNFNQEMGVLWYSCICFSILYLLDLLKFKEFAILIINNYNFFSLGHTHGGQFPPVVFGAYLFNPFYAGLYRYGDNSHVYVSMGTVYWGFPVRIMTMQEITSITLHTVWTNRIHIIYYWSQYLKLILLFKRFSEKIIFSLMKLQLHFVQCIFMHFYDS